MCAAVPASFADLAEAYQAERWKYERLCHLIAAEIEAKLRALHMEVVVEARAKEVLSFLKKALRKGYGDPMREIEDKAGIRVIVHYVADVSRVEEVVESVCEVHARESKLDALEYDQLGYLGVHLQVAPRVEILADGNRDMEGLRAEVQIHTKAQSAWAVVSHDLLYKSPIEVPSDLKRSITRLVALVEMFDAEVARFRDQLRDHPDFKEMQVIEPLDDLLVEFSSRPPDRGLSSILAPTLVRHLGKTNEDVVKEVVQPFVAKHRDKLTSIYARYADDYRATPLLFQPEAFLIFAALESDPYQLQAAWASEKLPSELLESMANVWGLTLGEMAF